MIAAALPATAAEPARPDLAGHVDGPSGMPAPDVMVMILAAGPRAGNSPLCPYVYPDCGKKTISDAQGNFRIPSLDPAMDFCIIALAPGCEPFTQSKIIPEAGPVTVKLRARDLSKVPPNWHVSGRIIGPDGLAVSGAIIDVEGVEQGETSRWGGNNVTEGTVVTDTNGEFHLLGHKDFTAVDTLVEATGLAPRWARLEPGKTILLRMDSGAAVRGRLVRDGRPVPRAALALSSVERECGKYFNGIQATTDDNGRFHFDHIPAAVDFQLFGRMDSLGAQGAAFQSEFVSAADSAAADLGDLQVQTSYRLIGRVVLSDGKPLPPKSRLMIDRSTAWDTTLVQLADGGAFDVKGVPGEEVSIILNIPGYRLSAKNPNLSPSNRADLVGRVTGDIAGMNILLEPGGRPNWNDIVRPSYEDTQKAHQLPLRGAP
jgi:hypothetical protein